MDRTTWDPQRFWSKVAKSDSCWEWTGFRDRKGYGRVTVINLGFAVPQLTHRVAWMLEHGSMPSADVFVCHSCDNPPCVRPSHLFLGSAADNTQDMLAKGRHHSPALPWELRTHGTRNGMARMTEASVIEMRKRAAAGESFRDLAPEYGVAASTANSIIIGNTWRHVWPFGEDNQPSRTVHPRPKRRRTTSNAAGT